MSALFKTVPILASLVYIGSKIANSYTNNLWHDLKFSIPIDKIKVGFESFMKFNIIAALQVENHFHLDIDLTDVHMTVFYKNKDGGLSELGSTPPKSKQWIIRSNSTSLIKNIKLNITTLSLFPALKALLKLPKGKRFKIVISGYVKSLPFTEEIWY